MSEEDRNVAVMLAYHYPPMIGVASDRAASFSRHLSDFGWRSLVVTPREGAYPTAGAGQDGPNVQRTGNFEVSLLLQRLARSVRIGRGGTADPGAPAAVNGNGGSGPSALTRLTRELVYVPDAQFGWIPFASRAAEQALEKPAGRRVLFSTSVPHSAHLAAMRVARRHRVPWVAECRDPWSTIDPVGQPTTRFRRGINRALERQILTKADRVVLPTRTVREGILDAFPELDPDRVVVITNGFEPVPPDIATPPESSQPMEVVFGGNLGLGEVADPVVDAFARIHADEPGSVRLVVVGDPTPWYERVPRAVGEPWFEFAGIVPPAEARRRMAASSALLLIQMHSISIAALPGKMFEYIGSRRPILGAVIPGTEMDTMLRIYADARLVGIFDPALIERELRRLLAEHRAGTLQAPRVTNEQVRPLERRQQARQLAALFDSLV